MPLPGQDGSLDPIRRAVFSLSAQLVGTCLEALEASLEEAATS
jgi:hypothetical protein